jgi:hypothetical protein
MKKSDLILTIIFLNVENFNLGSKTKNPENQEILNP